MFKMMAIGVLQRSISAATRLTVALPVTDQTPFRTETVCIAQMMAEPMMARQADVHWLK